MTFASFEDRNAIENEMPWDQRDVPATLYGQLSKTAAAFPDRPAASITTISESVNSRLTANSTAAKTETGSTIERTIGNNNAVNSRNTPADWPLFTTVSMTRSDWVSQITPVKTMTKNRNGPRI